MTDWNAAKRARWLARLRNEWAEWSLLHFCFDTALTWLATVLINALHPVPWSTLINIAVALFLAIWFGLLIYRRERFPEEARRREVYNLFAKLIEEGQKGSGWGPRQLGDWISRIEYTLRPLMPEEVDNFLRLFGARVSRMGQSAIMTDESSEQIRERCVAWLEAVCLKYWIMSFSRHPAAEAQSGGPSRE